MMLRSLKELIGYDVSASDGEVGRVHDFLFDGASRQIRYLVVETGMWPHHHYHLVAPVALGRPHWPLRELAIRVTREQVRASPEWQPETPLSRQQESRLHRYYEWLPYWLSHAFTGRPEAAPPPAAETTEPRLESAARWLGCRIQATDSDFGHATDFVIDDEHWQITKLVIDTEYWWPQWSVMVDLPSIVRAAPEQQQLFVSLSRDEIRKAPEYDATATVNHRQEMVLYDYLGRPRF